MTNKINFDNVVPIKQIQGDSKEDTAFLRKMATEATAFVKSFDWCRSLKRAYFGLGVGGIVAVFLVEIEPTRKQIDKWLWVVVGDLPPAYLVTEGNPTPLSALSTYIEEMTEWVAAARTGKPVEGLIPVNVPPTPANAKHLKTRLNLLKNNILPRYS